MIPSFIGDEWLFNDGWSFADTPGEDLLDPSRLASHAWDRVLFVLAAAKRGDFSHAEVLSELLADEQPHPLFLATMYLAAAMGGAGEQRAVVRWLGTEWYTQAATALVLSGDLAVVESLLARRRGADAERKEAMEHAVSHLLEPEPDRFYETSLDDDGYDALVRAEVAMLVARHGVDYRVVLGAPLRPRTLLEKLETLAGLERDSLHAASAVVGTIAFHLETLTGLPSRGIVTLDAADDEVVDHPRLQRFIDTASAWNEKHRPRSGRRLFFGHLVP